MPDASTLAQTNLPPHEYAELLKQGPFKDALRQDLAVKGWHVVAGAIPSDQALEIRHKAFQWLENFELGFDRNDEATWTDEHMPPHIKGGMFASRVFHESWVWEVRAAPGVIGAFEQLWGTSKLTTSFDAASVMLHHRKDLPDPKSVTGWEHMDQNPARTGFFCAQGLVNLNENGPEDGGLMVLEGSSLLVEEYFRLHPEEKVNHNSWGPADWYGFSQEQQQWFFDRGCEWKKICAGPGDLILWDSRCMHYNVRPSGDRDRVCTYVCMAPDSLLQDKDRRTKQELFKTLGATTHNPFDNIFAREPEEGKVQDPVKPDDIILRLAAVLPYEKDE